MKSRGLNRTWMPWQYMKINFTHLIERNDVATNQNCEPRRSSHRLKYILNFVTPRQNHAFLSYTALILDHYYF